jgi:hypothetical protein
MDEHWCHQINDLESLSQANTLMTTNEEHTGWASASDFGLLQI